MIIAVLIPPFASGLSIEGDGQHTVIRNLCRQLASHGHTPRLIVPGGAPEPKIMTAWQHLYATAGVRVDRQDSLIMAGRDARGGVMRDARDDLVVALQDCELCIVFDTVFDVHCVALAAAVREAAHATGTRLVFYSFECTWPLPQPNGFDWSQVDRSPWNVIQLAASEFEHAFPAAATLSKIASITGTNLKKCWTLPPVLDLGDEDHLGPDVICLWSELGLWDNEVVFLPALRRRNDNIEMAVRVVAEMKAAGRRPRLLLTYLTGYDDETQDESRLLRATIESLDLRQDVVFLSELRPAWRTGLPRRGVQTIYQLCDLVLHPSAWEGFGLVPVEAVLARAPLLAADLPVLREVVGDAAHFVAADAPASVFARKARGAPRRPAEPSTPLDSAALGR